MKKRILSSILLCFIAVGLVMAQQKPTLTSEDYKIWQRLSADQISNNGTWVAYQISTEGGEDTLYLRNMETDSLYKEAYGSGVQFSPDSKFAVYRIGVSKKQQEALEEKKQPLHYKMALLDLSTGQKVTYQEVSSFRLPEKGLWLAMTMYPPKDFKGKGQDMVLMNLNDRSTRTVGNVSEFAFNKSGTHLAYIVQPVTALGNGTELLDLTSMKTRTLASDTVAFSNLSWEKDGNSLAFLKTIKSEDYEEEGCEVLVFRNVAKGEGPQILNPLNHQGFPTSMRITTGRLAWADDESAISFGVKEWTRKEKKEDPGKKDEGDSTGVEKVKPKNSVTKPDKKEKLPGVDVWHWRDPEIQPRQQKTYTMDKNRSFLTVWNLSSNHCLQIADTLYESASLSGDYKNAWVYGGKRYEPQFRLTYNDYYLVNLETGQRKLVMEHHTGYWSGSPAGKFILYFSENNWWTYNLSTHQRVNLTGSMDQPFWDIRDDHPAEVRPPFGSGGWIKDDKYILLYDEFDVWAFTPDGSKSMRLTDGREKEIIFRVSRLDYTDPWLDPEKPLLFSMNGDKTKDSGYASMKWGKKPEVLMYEAKRVYGLTKAKEADRFVFSTSTYVESPVLKYVKNDFQNAQVVAISNPQQEKYAWGKAELIDFTSKTGKDLQGVLHYPANYEPGKQYPMVVYIYEIRSTSLHSYLNPSDKSSYNITNYVQDGFFVFQPDIVYRLDDPGISAVECVVPAVEKVLATGMVNPDKIGLMGHSWGAYQTAFIITQTDLFSAAVAGAPLTDMISMYTEVYWNSGSPNQGIFETSQGRFTKPYWEIMDKYLANSPMFQAANIKTPLLVAFGDNDGAVDWHQGIELYTTMRRMEKPMVMLVYAGENHGLRKEENMKDYTKRIKEWYDHFLLGQDASAWITEGVPYLEKMKKEEATKK